MYRYNGNYTQEQASGGEILVRLSTIHLRSRGKMRNLKFEGFTKEEP